MPVIGSDCRECSEVLILALETSSLAGSVALLSGDQLLTTCPLAADRRSTQTLIPTIDRLLKDTGREPTDIRLVAVTAGPGSFTGLRLGVTTAKTLAYATGADVLGLDTLEVIADQSRSRFNADSAPAEIHAILDAQRKELFLARFAWRGANLQRLDDNRIVRGDEWLAQLPPGALVTGPALSRWEVRLPPGVIAADLILRQPQAETVGRLALAYCQSGRRDDLWKLAPVYLRPSAAEERAENNSRALS